MKVLMGFRLIFAAKLRGVLKFAGGFPPETEVVSNKLVPKIGRRCGE
jgi:hypothetical protein